MRDSRPDRPVERVERRHQDPLASRSPGAQSPLWPRSQTDPVERGRSGPRAGATGRLPAVERGSAPVDWIDRFPLVSISSLIGGRSTLIGRARRSGADRRWCPRRPGPPPRRGSLCARVCTPFARDPQLSAGASLLGSAREAPGRRPVPSYDANAGTEARAGPRRGWAYAPRGRGPAPPGRVRTHSARDVQHARDALATWRPSERPRGPELLPRLPGRGLPPTRRSRPGLSTPNAVKGAVRLPAALTGSASPSQKRARARRKSGRRAHRPLGGVMTGDGPGSAVPSGRMPTATIANAARERRPPRRRC